MFLQIYIEQQDQTYDFDSATKSMMYYILFDILYFYIFIT